MPFYLRFLVLIVLFCATARAEVPESMYLQGPPPVVLPPAARQLIEWETQSNAAAQRSPRPFWIEHLEIPLDALDADISKQIDSRVQHSLIFEKGGKKFVRWILNPEDTQWGAEVEKYLATKGLDSARKRRFIGYSTASRSCIVQDPDSGVVFSIKSSTNQTAGYWKDKKETVRAAKATRLISDYLFDTAAQYENKEFNFIPETFSLSIPGIDQAVVVRQYDLLNDPNPKTLLMPAFAAVNEKEGQRIAQINGTSDTQEFWTKNLIRPLGEFTAEMGLFYGLFHNSPHFQNFLVELDARTFRPTGKIYLRDLADVHLLKGVLEANHAEKVISHYKSLNSSSNILYSDTVIGMLAPFRGQPAPRWVTSERVIESAFKNSFSVRVSEILDIDMTELAQNDMSPLIYADGNWYSRISLEGSSFSGPNKVEIQAAAYLAKIRKQNSGEFSSADLRTYLQTTKSAKQFLFFLKKSKLSSDDEKSKIAAESLVIFKSLHPTLDEQNEYLKYYRNPLLKRLWNREGTDNSPSRKNQCFLFLGS